MPLSQQAKEGIAVLGWGDRSRLHTMEERKIMSGAQEIFYGLSWCYHPVVKVNEKLQQPSADRIATRTDPSGMMVWVTPQKELAETGGNAGA